MISIEAASMLMVLSLVAGLFIGIGLVLRNEGGE